MRQARHAHRAQLRAIGKVHAQTRLRAGAGQRNADVAVEYAQRRIVARDHDGAPGIPLATPTQQARSAQRSLDSAVEPGGAPLALAHGAQQAKAFERSEHAAHPVLVRKAF